MVRHFSMSRVHSSNKITLRTQIVRVFGVIRQEDWLKVLLSSSLCAVASLTHCCSAVIEQSLPICHA